MQNLNISFCNVQWYAKGQCVEGDVVAGVVVLSNVEESGVVVCIVVEGAVVVQDVVVDRVEEDTGRDMFRFKQT